MIAIAATTWLIMAASIYDFKVPGLEGNEINLPTTRVKRF
jgi:hypothetical protein